VGAGLCVSQAGQGSFQMLAAELFEQALPVAASSCHRARWHSRSSALTNTCGGSAVTAREPDSRIAHGETHATLHRRATDEWQWFEEVVSYANAKLPHAMISTDAA